MSCRPAVGMPNTRQYIVRRLDSQEQEVTLQKKATGGECLDRVSPSWRIFVSSQTWSMQLKLYEFGYDKWWGCF